MTHPPQLDRPDAITRLLRLDNDLGLVLYRIGQVLVEPHPVAWECRVPAYVLFRSRVESLRGLVEAGRSGKCAVEAGRFYTELGIFGRKRVEDLLFLNTRSVLFSPC